MAGHPKLFETPEQLKEAFDEYFREHPLGARTITGLALYCGFESRQSFYDYEKLPEYSYIIKTARMEVENSYEISLYGKNPTGSIFALKNMGWRDKVETGFTDSEGRDVQPQIIFQPAPNCQAIEPTKDGE